MKRGIVLALAGAATLAAGMSGCSSDKSTKSESGAASTSASVSEHASSGASEAKVSIDGKDQNISGTTTCAAAAGQVSIAIGGSATGIGVILTDAEPPGVTSVALGNVNGVTLAYAQGAGQGDATATKDGKSYHVTGTATGVDMANPMEPVKKPFQIDATCP